MDIPVFGLFVWQNYLYGIRKANYDGDHTYLTVRRIAQFWTKNPHRSKLYKLLLRRFATMDELENYRIEEMSVGDTINVWTIELKTIKEIRDDVPNRWRYLTFTDGYVRRYCFGKVILGNKLHSG